MALIEPHNVHRSSRWTAMRRALGAALRAMANPTTPLVPPPRFVVGLHECLDCGRDRVGPIEREVAGEDRWTISLRCGDCGARRESAATDAQVAELDRVLDRQRQAIERELERLDSERMAEELEAFVRALADDLIDAADFAAG